MPFTTYQETVDYLYRALPMFQRVGAVAFKKDLTNTVALCEALGNPQCQFKSIHIAGTNGKGSASHMLASILQSAGYRTGLYTSPHLKAFTERIRINGEEVQQQFVIDFVNRIQPLIDQVKPSFFEITVAMAFDYFASQRVDVAVIEVGLGGRLDSTNVITPEVSLITNIGMDHKDLLGDTLEQIAFEKAGIIKPGVPVVISERQAAVSPVFQDKAEVTGSELTYASDRYRAAWRPDGTLDVWKGSHLQWEALPLPLKGVYQQKNVPGVLSVCDVLTARGYALTIDTIRDGLVNVVTQTHLKGRWQKLQEQPLVVCDTGHNAEGVAEVMQQIRQQTYQQLYIVWGMVRDKDPSAILQLLPRDAYYFFCQASIPRALPAVELAEKARVAGLRGEVAEEVNTAVAAALAKATPKDFVFVGGSTFVVAEINNL